MRAQFLKNFSRLGRLTDNNLYFNVQNVSLLDKTYDPS